MEEIACVDKLLETLFHDRATSNGRLFKIATRPFSDFWTCPFHRQAPAPYFYFLPTLKKN